MRACMHICVDVCVCLCVFVARVLNLKDFEKATQLRIQDGEFARKDSESASVITVLESESRAVHVSRVPHVGVSKETYIAKET